MLNNWGFLINEMMVLIILAALLGLLVGWLIWGRIGTQDNHNSHHKKDLQQLENELQACRAKQTEKDTRIAALQMDLDALDTAVQDTSQSLAAINDIGTEDYIEEEVDDRFKPAVLTAARNGQPDDLTRILGIGPKLEQLCHELGFFHFDQIANWTEHEVAWVDANLDGFKGRVSRDRWVQQAQQLAKGNASDNA